MPKLDDIFNMLPATAARQIRRRTQPAWCDPMLATLVREPFSDKDWIFEPKLDGVRCLAFRKGSKLDLFSRNHIRLNDEFPELISGLLHQPASSFIVDGEIVALEHGVSRFSLLQKRKQKRVPTFYYIFDVLFLEGCDLTHLELRYRKELLEKAFAVDDPLRLSRHRGAQGESYYREACKKGWEGLIAKRAASEYVHRRSWDWQKLKCENQQEFVIVGYTEPAGQRVGIGAVLVGFYEKGKLLYAGKVGTGFDTQTLRDLETKLSAIERPAPACIFDSRKKAGVHWVQPKFVAQIGFTEWTGAGKLRHPRYLGLRTDKKPSEVVREKPQ
ncbi:MAG TPA: non-homologous end-joining DNA ligase [Terriglobia bacterium]|jgi:DNA ligase D-like protein (predicted ligase)